MNQNQNIVIPITKNIIRQKSEKGKLLNQYMKIKKIGQGNFAKIKLMNDTKTGKQVAMKKFNLFILKKKIKMGAKVNGQIKYTNQAQQVYNQIQIMKKINHPNLIRLYEILQDDQQQKVYLIMDYCKHGDIAIWNSKNQTFMTKWTLRQLAKLFKQTANGLQYLHSINIVHRDIKPQNILVTQDETAKIIDFGRSTQLQNDEQKLSGSQGTYHFMAPETLSQRIQGGYNGKLCDIWSLGISLYCCVFGKLPFNHELLVKLFQKIQKGQYQFPKNINPGQSKFVPIIQGMLQLDWNKRPTLKQVSAKLQQIQKNI